MRTLRFGDSLIEPQVRMLSDINEVVYDQKWLKNSPDMELYYMYRDLALTGDDRAIMKRENLRYDITIIPPAMLGEEYVKTAGHYHPLVPGTNHSYTEIYEVLEGEAHYLLQKLENGKIADVILIEAKQGDKIIMPPGYGHITINPSKEELKMANFVSDRFSSVYEPIREKKGGAYFELTGGFVKNGTYGDLPQLRRVRAGDLSEFGLGGGGSDGMYPIIREDPVKLEFLNTPGDHPWLLGLY